MSGSRVPLTVRHIDFRFDAAMPFQCNPANPWWSNFVNFMALIGPGFERYFIRAIRQAMPQIRDPAVRADAELFCQQEAQHARQHLAHLKVLTARFPGLEDVRREVTASYERLYERERLAFHLSYAATVELCFGPFAAFLVEHRDALFKGGDRTIASFVLWHFVEEFEHRNSAIGVYRDVVGSHLYRVRTAPAVRRHLAEVGRIVSEGFERHVPAGTCAVPPGDVSRMFAAIPRWSRLRVAVDLACTLLPRHDPDRIAQPPWVTQWFAADAAGADMAAYYR